MVKNKVAPPFRQAEFDLMHDRGISREGDLINLALEDKLIDKSGAWLNYGEMRLGQGREKAKEYLRENPALLEEISRKILEKRGLLGVLTKPATPAFEPEPAPVPEKTRGRKQAAAAGPSDDRVELSHKESFSGGSQNRAGRDPARYCEPRLLTATRGKETHHANTSGLGNARVWSVPWPLPPEPHGLRRMQPRKRTTGFSHASPRSSSP